MGKTNPGPDDERFMSIACKLALRGKGKTKPNPMVGAVLVKHGNIIGSGYHKQFGSRHAEVVALKNVQEEPAGATLYVNLEPCAHHGRTPPCLDLILEKKISRVVIGTMDPNPLVCGKSIRVLKKNGVQVNCGILEAKCRRLNETFFKFMENGKPFVTLKAALSLDGKIACASGQSQWISCDASRRKAHRYRRLVDAIIVGIGTVLKDNPQLTPRGVPGTGNPMRVILDSSLRIPLEARILQADAPTLLATTSKAPKKKLARLKEKGILVEVLSPNKNGRIPFAPLMKRLGKRNIQHVMIEGGTQIYTSALEEKEVDKLLLFIAPVLLGGKAAPGLFAGKGFDTPANGYTVSDLRMSRSDRDVMLEGYLSYTGT